MEPLEYRRALGCFATGVTVISVRGPDGAPVGITANSFNSVSMEPPLILFSLSRGSYSLQAFLDSPTFAVNVLRDNQQSLSKRFARAGSDKWSNVGYDIWDTGCPILHDALAKFECRLRHTYEGGDHIIFVGEVLRFEYDPRGRPLVYYCGTYCTMPPKS
jgi:3-hydroxy-9,10-secoandrosta-1,3,5(10)-triene-9,17-dione monooxygenase reductase component